MNVLTYVKQYPRSCVSGRSLYRYNGNMRFDPLLLEGKRVLDFGCGGSNIGRELGNMGINTEVVAVDRLNSPVTGVAKNVDIFLFCIECILRNGGISTNTLQKVREIIPKSRRGRNFIQTDGLELPFKDNEFDITFASWSTYQIDQDNKMRVYSEIMRVSKCIHIGPITMMDYDMLTELATENGYEIIICQKAYTNGEPDPNLAYIKTDNDYDLIKQRFEYDERVYAPRSKDMHYSYLYGGAEVGSGNLMILRKV